MTPTRRRAHGRWTIGALLTVVAAVAPAPAASAAPERGIDRPDRAERLEAREAARRARTAEVKARVAERTARAAAKRAADTAGGAHPAAPAPVAPAAPARHAVTAPAAGAPSVAIDKAVDPVPQFQGQLVTVSVTVTNTSPVPVVVTGIVDTDLNTGTTTPVCPGLVGNLLQPGASRTCVIFFGPAKLDDRDRARVDVVAANGVTASAEDSLHWNLQSEGIPPRLDVVKTNDADHDGVFNDVETAEAPGSPVAFHVDIRNAGVTPITLTALTDEVPVGGTGFPVCPELVGRQLLPNQSVACLFTLPGYAPAFGSTLIDLVRVRGQLFGLQLEANDPSTVNTRTRPPVEMEPPPNPPADVAPPVVTPPPAVPPTAAAPSGAAPTPPAAPARSARQGSRGVEALAFTGFRATGLSVLGGLAFMSGVALLCLVHHLPRRRRAVVRR